MGKQIDCRSGREAELLHSHEVVPRVVRVEDFVGSVGVPVVEHWLEAFEVVFKVGNFALEGFKSLLKEFDSVLDITEVRHEASNGLLLGVVVVLKVTKSGLLGIIIVLEVIDLVLQVGNLGLHTLPWLTVR